MTNYLIEIENLSISAPHTRLVHGSSFKVKEGTITALIGESGSGKSLTVRAIIDLLPKGLTFASGSIMFSGENVRKMSTSRKNNYLGKDVGIVFQDTWQSFDPIKTVGYHFLELFRVHTNLTKSQAKKEALKLLKLVKMKNPERIYKSHPHELSGGMRQRVQLALAIALQPKFLIADEPTTALDLKIQAAILSLIEEWQKQTNSTVLFITHDLSVVAKIADEVIVMSGGKVIETSPVNELFERPKTDQVKQLLKDYQVLAEPRVKVHSAKEKPIMIIDRISKTYVKKKLFKTEEVEAVIDATMHIHRGEVVGLIGESGGGKSTITRLMLKIEQSNKGSVSWFGGKSFRSGVQWVHQDPIASFDPRWTVGKIVAEGLDYSKEIVGNRKERVVAALTKVGLPSSVISLYPDELSGGMKQRVALARALIVEPELIILDEPFASLDMSSQAKMVALIRSINECDHTAIFFISHDIRAAMALCQRIYVLKNGRIIEEALSDELFRSTEPYTQSLLSYLPISNPYREI